MNNDDDGQPLRSIVYPPSHKLINIWSRERMGDGRARRRSSRCCIALHRGRGRGAAVAVAVAGANAEERSCTHPALVVVAVAGL